MYKIKISMFSSEKQGPPSKAALMLTSPTGILH